MSAESLEASLRAAGIRCRVDAMERLAVLVPERGGNTGENALEDESVRRRAVGMLRAHGFTHLALEIEDEPADV